MKNALLFFILMPVFCLAQTTIFEDEVPKDLDQNKIIFFKHEPIKVIADKEAGKQGKYLHLRQSNHNEVIKEANKELATAALEYPFGYAIASKSTFEPLLKAGYKYILDSRAYEYDNLMDQPKEDELIVYEFFIRDLNANVAYKVFEMTEMQIYDSKLLIKRLNKALKDSYPDSY